MQKVEQNHEEALIYLGIQIRYVQSTREVGAGVIDVEKRKMFVSEFQDNDHFSNLESFIFQMSPQNQYNKVVVLIHLPDLVSEKSKVLEIVEQISVKVVERTKKDFPEVNFEVNLAKLVNLPFQQYLIESQKSLALQAIDCILNFSDLHKEQSNYKQFSLENYVLTDYMKLDLAAINALLIFPKNSEQNKKYNDLGCTLLELLDQCKTQIGSRVLKRWMKQPLQDVNKIRERQNLVEFFLASNEVRNFLQNDFFRKIADLEKLYSKFYKVHSDKKHNCQLSDVLKVYQLIKQLRSLVAFCKQQKRNAATSGVSLENAVINPFESCLEDFEKLEQMIEKSIDLEKARVENEYQVNPKYSETLLQLSKEMNTGRQQIEALRTEIQDSLGISVDLVESQSHTFLFEAKKKEADEAFRRTTQNQKRYKTISIKQRLLSFTTEQLQGLVAEYNHLKESYQDEQRSVVEKILKIVSSYYPALELASELISQLDVYCTLAAVVLSAPKSYVKPKFVDQPRVLKLTECRHPCLESGSINVVPNDCIMDKKARFHLITGPNMGGKSTYIRQVAICALLAHIGAYVPCDSAELSIIDAIITRVGANDLQLRGISTFMSEMLETSCMLKTATDKSLIIIDELGRGTSTTEGFGIAWALSEHIISQVESFCLFATHFHELTQMSEVLEGVKNYYVSCITLEGKLTMQYKVLPGKAEKSYGLFVAEMLNFPSEILENARRKLQELEDLEDGSDFVPEEDPYSSEQQMQIEKSNDLLFLAQNANLQQKEAALALAQKYNLFSDRPLQEINKLEMKKLKTEIIKLLQGMGEQ